MDREQAIEAVENYYGHSRFMLDQLVRHRQYGDQFQISEKQIETVEQITRGDDRSVRHDRADERPFVPER